MPELTKQMIQITAMLHADFDIDRAVLISIKNLAEEFSGMAYDNKISQILEKIQPGRYSSIDEISKMTQILLTQNESVHK